MRKIKNRRWEKCYLTDDLMPDWLLRTKRETLLVFLFQFSIRFIQKSIIKSSRNHNAIFLRNHIANSSTNWYFQHHKVISFYFFFSVRSISSGNVTSNLLGAHSHWPFLLYYCCMIWDTFSGATCLIYDSIVGQSWVHFQFPKKRRALGVSKSAPSGEVNWTGN